MLSWNKIVRGCLLVMMLAMAGCNTTQPTAAVIPTMVIPTAAPTQDLNVIRTAAAQTVIAQITEEALKNPTATTEPIAAALPPTETQAPVAVVATLTPLPTVTATKKAFVAYPTRTSTPYTDSAKYITQTIPDGKVFPPGQDFDIRWTVQNTGFRDWNKEFYYKFVGGNMEPENKLIMLERVVEKGDSIQLLAEYNAPHAPGRYTSNWVIVNDDGTAFFRMYLVIVVK